MGLLDFLPWYAWALIALFATVASLGLLIPPTVSSVIGLSVGQHLVVVVVVEGASALGIVGVLTYYRTPPEEQEPQKWRFDP